METHIAAVWDVDLSDAHTAACIHNFHFVRAVDHHIKFRPINAYVVAHVAELLHHCRIFLGIEITRIKPCVIVVIIKAALVRTHIALIDKIESPHRAARRLVADYLILRGHNQLILAAGGESQQQRQCQKSKYVCLTSHILTVNVMR